MRMLPIGVVLWATLIQGALAQEQDDRPPAVVDAAAEAEAKKQQQAAERFLAVLEKTPRRGTALDRLYGYHVEQGTLESFVRSFRERTVKNQGDGPAWMILGLIESQRGRDSAAVDAFREAETARPDDPLASYYLGQSLVLVGLPDEAAAAFERAIARKPQRSDQLDIFQSLGRVYQRAQKGDQALAVWTRLEQQFPDDLRVQEQIAQTLVEEGQPELALPRFEALAAKVKDEYRVAAFKIEAADIKVRLGRKDEALADFEKLLERLNPDNWLFRDVRRRIDEVFLRSDDQAGLAAYYEDWAGKHKDDVEALTRLARVLANLGRIPEAQTWLDKALKLAPSRKDLRLALIDHLVAQKQVAAAIEQYELLAKGDPNNPDHLREWGRLILRDTTRPELERKEAASAVWRKLLDARPKDSLTATQVADLFRQNEMPEEALALYQRAVELSPDSAQYREYLGEFYHLQKRKDDALATWREIAAGKNHTAENLARLAEVLAGFGYIDEAVENVLEACRLDDDEFKYPVQAAALLGRAEKYDDALAQLDRAEKLADGAEDAETLLLARIRNLQLADKLEATIEDLKTRLSGEGQAPAKSWYLLARYREAAHEYPDAIRDIGRALALEEKSVPYRATAARIQEAAGNMQDAADSYRELAAIDRRFRTEHLTHVARLEAQLGRADQALQAGRDLLAAAPGNAENYEFFSQLCFQLGKIEEGLDALRRSVRLNPTEPKGMLTLAAALSDQFRTDEAIELYWRAFDKSAELEARTGVIQKLTDLYLQINRFDRLIERLERERREPAHQREMTICLAQAHQSAGDFGTARLELERLLAQNARDTPLLQQLSTLSESEGDIVTAIKYQQQLVSVAPGKESEMRLAQLLVRGGEADEASAIWLKLTTSEDDPAKLLMAVDSLISHDRRDTALAVIERLLREQPGNWELLYREGTALVTDKPDSAAERFRALLALRLPDDEPGAQAKARQKAASSRPATAAAPAARRFAMASLQERQNVVYQIRSIAGFDSDRYFSPGYVWSPGDFGTARMATLAWLLRISERAQTAQDWLDTMRAASERPDADARDVWDWYYLQLVRQDYKEVYEAARRLSRSSDAQGQWLYLSSLGMRALGAGGSRSRRAASNSQGDTTPPLPPEEVDYMLACFDSLEKKQPDVAASVRPAVMTELKRAGRTEAEAGMYAELIRSDKPDRRGMALSLAIDRGDLETAMALHEKIMESELAALAASKKSQRGGIYGFGNNVNYDSVQRLMALRAESGAYPDVIRLFDGYMSYVQRGKVILAGTRAPRRSQNSNQSARGRWGAQFWIGKTQRSATLGTPTIPNERLDYYSIMVLREAFELYKAADLMSDLIAHCRDRADAVPEAERVTSRLSLAYLLWWNDEQEQSLAEIAKAAELDSADQTLQFQLAEWYEERQEFDNALATVEKVAALDHHVMQQRETFALRLAVRIGDVDRARQAAERLFGLRLDAETQVALAAEMRPLGMHELAEAVLSRARQQAGNRVNALVGLMTQYQAEQKPELAVQVAHQLLRRGAASPAQGRNRGYTENDVARQQALQVLARSGKLKELIERVEAQLKAAPSSTALYQTLAEYYQAAGDRAKSLEVLERQAQLRPDDAKLRMQIATQLAQSNPAAAIEHYKFAITKEPALLQQSYYEVQNAFQSANKIDEMASLMDQIDLKAVGQYYYVMNLISNLLQNDKNRATGLKLFKKAWAAFPDNRPYLLGSLYSDELWSIPEVYDYAREGLFPADGVALSDPWGSQSGLSFSGDGKVTSGMSRLIEAATKQNRLPQLEKEIDEKLQKRPEWSGGKLLKAVIAMRNGRPDEARQIIDGLLADKANPIPTYSAWIAGQELENFENLRPQARALYESTINQSDTNLEFSYSPIRRLVGIYQKSGQLDKARELLFKISKPNNDYSYDPSYAAYRKVENVAAIGGQLVDLGFSADAVKVYSEVLEDDGLLQDVALRFGGGYDYYTNRAQGGYNKALAALTAQNLAGNLATVLAPRPESERRPGEPIVDLALLVRPKELHRAELTSVAAIVVSAASRSEALQAGLAPQLADLVAAHPDDFPARILGAVGAFRGGEPTQITAAVSGLVALVDRFPLDDLPAGARANARQRAAAQQQVGLWLVARECLNSNEHRALGEKLGERALAAARRQIDRRPALAILRERGQFALDRNDRAGAETRWTEMLELVLPPPAPAQAATAPPTGRPAAPPAGAVPAAGSCDTRAPQAAADRTESDDDVAESNSESVPEQESIPAETSATGDCGPQQKAAAKPQPGAKAVKPPPPAGAVPAPGAAPAQAKPAARGPLVPPATVLQFNQALEIATLAAEKGFTDLSLRAVTQSLAGGPPAKVEPGGQGFGSSSSMQMRAIRRSSRSGGPEEEQSPILQQVAARLETVVALWNRERVPTERIFEALLSIVLPDARGTEIFLYPQPLMNTGIENPRSVGRLLATAAAQSGRGDALRQRVAARISQPSAALPGEIVLALVAQEQRDDAATQAALEAIARHVEGDNLQYSAELAAHAALGAVDNRELAATALSLLETTIARQVAQPQLNSEEPLRSLALRVVRARVQRGEIDKAQAQLRTLEEAMQRMYVNYGGDYGSYRRKELVQQIANELSQSGLLDESLEFLGKFADLPTYPYGDPSVSSGLAFVSKFLAPLPAQARYERLKAWTLPTASRPSVRILAGFWNERRAPAAFRDQMAWNRRNGAEAAPTAAAPAPRQSTPTAPLVNTVDLLIDAARECNRLDELSAEVQDAAAKSLDNAQALAALVALARHDFATALPYLQKQVDEYPARRAARNPNQRTPAEWDLYLLARAGVQQGETRGLSERLLQMLLDQSKQSFNQQWIAALHYDIASSIADRNPAAELAAGQDPGLVHWHPGEFIGPSGSGSEVGAWWIAGENHVSHIAGPEADFLYFDYPLSGKFEFSAESTMANWNEGSLSFAGLVFEAFHGGTTNTSVWPVGHHEQLSRPEPPERPSEFNRTTIQVDGSHVRVVCNGQTVYVADDLSPTSPWLALLSQFNHHSHYRNLTLTGEIRIPREVPLIYSDRFEGWIVNGSRPPRLSVGQPVQYQPDQIVTLDTRPDAYQWSAADGVLSSRRMEGAVTDFPARAHYNRPLRSKDVVQYQFLYEPGRVECHPALGRLAFLLEPQGVRLHWIVDVADRVDAWSGLKSDNVLDEPQNGRGKGPLPLKAGEWNDVQLTLEGDRVVLHLNGAEIYRRTLESEVGHQFGLYHNAAKTAAKVRNAVLTGDWPESLPTAQPADLLAARIDASRESVPTRRARHAIHDEGTLVRNWETVQQAARALPPPRRYALLRRWVLPTEEHHTFRLMGGFTQVCPPGENPVPSAGSSESARLVVTGGELTSPALDLIAAAREANQLDELSTAILQSPVEDDFDQRSKLALLALVALARPNEQAAAGYIQQLRPLLDKVAVTAPPFHRWPEFLVASVALDSPALRPAAVELIQAMTDLMLKQGVGPRWDQPLHALRGRARVLLLSEGERGPVSTASTLGQWRAVSHGNAETLGAANPAAQWSTSRGKAIHAAGNNHDYLYFQSPLRGNFEVNAKLSTFDWREIQLSYAGIAAGVLYTHRNYELLNYGRVLPQGTIEPPMAALAETYDYRLVVQDGSYTAYVNGRKMHEQALPRNPDPWLAIHSWNWFSGAVRDLRITGNPVIPESLDLTELPDLSAWLADYYYESISGDNPDWKKPADEIVGRRRPELAGASRQSLLRYNRPLLEDGQIEYDFYYDPGKTLVHPALGRLTFLVEPAGIRLHWLTDAQHDRSGLPQDNVTDIPSERRGPASLPLKENDWNRMLLEVKGDVVMLSLNGSAVYERPIEAANPRFFGLFHYSDQSEVRVRNVSYRGGWPRTLPPLADQQLADETATAAK